MHENDLNVLSPFIARHSCLIFTAFKYFCRRCKYGLFFAIRSFYLQKVNPSVFVQKRFHHLLKNRCIMMSPDQGFLVMLTPFKRLKIGTGQVLFRVIFVARVIALHSWFFSFSFIFDLFFIKAFLNLFSFRFSSCFPSLYLVSHFQFLPLQPCLSPAFLRSVPLTILCRPTMSEWRNQAKRSTMK